MRIVCGLFSLAFLIVISLCLCMACAWFLFFFSSLQRWRNTYTRSSSKYEYIPVVIGTRPRTSVFRGILFVFLTYLPVSYSDGVCLPYYFPKSIFLVRISWFIGLDWYWVTGCLTGVCIDER